MKTFLIALSILTAGAMIGCDSGGPDPAVEQNRQESAAKMSALFEQAGGDYERLTPEQKSEWLGFFDGNEANAKQSWDFMKSKRTGDQGVTSAGQTGAGMPGNR